MMNEDLGSIENLFKQVRDELITKMDEMKSELKSDISNVESKLKREINELRNDMENLNAVVSIVNKRKSFERNENINSGGGFDRAIAPTTGVGLNFRPHRTEFF